MLRQKISNVVEHVLDAQQLRRAPRLPRQFICLLQTDAFTMLHCDIWKMIQRIFQPKTG